jgi:hypothetical protein
VPVRWECLQQLEYLQLLPPTAAIVHILPQVLIDACGFLDEAVRGVDRSWKGGCLMYPKEVFCLAND